MQHQGASSHRPGHRQGARGSRDPRGAESGKTGGALPVKGGIVLSTADMTKIIDIDEKDMVAVVEPGVITGDFQKTVLEQGMLYPPDPASLSMCSLGGNIAENAGGPSAFKYGVTRDFTLGVEVATPTHPELKLGRRTPKGVTGFDLTALFVGSEGTMGIATEITLRLLGAPADKRTLIAAMPTSHQAGIAIGKLLRSGVRPAAVEIMDRNTVRYLRQNADTTYALPVDAGALVLVEVDGLEQTVETEIIYAGQIFEANGAVDCFVSKDHADNERMWQTRRLCSQSLKKAFKFKISEDINVPIGRLPQTFDGIESIGREYQLTTACFGHAGDGNLHVQLLSDEDRNEPAFQRRVEKALDAVFRLCLSQEAPCPVNTASALANHIICSRSKAKPSSACKKT